MRLSLSESVDRGLEYIRSRQAKAGYWSDWRLPPGESKMWTTAYIGHRLCSLAETRHGVDDALARAAEWLAAAELPGGGWGYAQETGVDADSTALALLFLRGRRHHVSPRAYERLAAHQRGDGGFSTFTDDVSWGSWVRSQPDVTATALSAMISSPAASQISVADGTRYLSQQRRPDGLWNSFWWTSCLYATETALEYLQAAREPLDDPNLASSLRLVAPTTPFERALLLRCVLHLDRCDRTRATEDARALADTQLSDGSWPATAELRITRREITEPWAVEDAGPIFTDERRLFTTATVVSALAAVEADRPDE